MPGFIFTDKEGKTIGEGEGENPTQAAKAAGITDYFQARDAAPLGLKAIIEAGKKKARKPHADLGQPRKGKTNTAVQPTKKQRNRGLYFVFGNKPVAQGTEEQVKKFLKDVAPIDFAVVRGYLYEHKREIKDTLKPVH